MDLLATLSRLPGSGQFTVTRSQGGGSYVNGSFVPGTAGSLTIQASVQPLSGQDLLRYPEGERTKDRIRVYSVTPLQLASQGVQADLISYSGKMYQVEEVLSWAPFCKAIAVSVGG